MQLLYLVAAAWSTRLQSTLNFTGVGDVTKAHTVFAKAAPNAGKDHLVRIHPCTSSADSKKLQTVSIAGVKISVPDWQFEFQKVVYHSHSQGRNTFTKRCYPIHQTIQQYLSHGGYGYHNITLGSNNSSREVKTVPSADAIAAVEAEFAAGFRVFGRNEFEIPLPSFLDLYVEHLTAPFFVFQVICLVLWSLDDYWYYSVVTLMLLMFFESMLCRQRLSSLQMLPEEHVCI